MGEHARTGIQQSKGLPRDVMAIQLGLMLATVPPDERPEWTRRTCRRRSGCSTRSC